ncbi:MAG: cytochrome c oxidase subunit II [Terrimicrobiaceae bacterium]|nr:cytochrome c oxidase subunit II [Terrimicrobiaceae bacterium]
MKTSLRAFFQILIVAILVAPASAAERAGNLFWAPETVTIGGQKVDQLLNFIFGLTLIVFILTQVVYVVYLIRYRKRPGHKAHYSHGNNTLEFWWTAIPTAIFLSLAIWSNRVWFELTKTPPPADALVVDIVSYQFGFDFRYPGADGKLGSADVKRISTENKFGVDLEDPAGTDDFTSTEFVMPVGRPVHVLLRSRDVIHSIYIPQFRLYQDAVPGRTIKWVWFETTKTGEFELACSQLCGTGHYNMKARIRVVPQDVYDKWFGDKVKAAAEAAALAKTPPITPPLAAATAVP